MFGAAKAQQPAPSLSYAALRYNRSCSSFSFPESFIQRTSALIRSRNHQRPAFVPLRTSRWMSSEQDPSAKKVDRKSSRFREAKTSLGRVAVAAGLSRGRSEHRTSTRKDPATRIVTAYGGAERYDIEKVTQILQDAGHTLDPSSTGLYPEVVHFGHPGNDKITSKHERPDDTSGDVFIFPSGTVVAWNVETSLVKSLINSVLLPAAQFPGSGEMEIEDLEYYEDHLTDTSLVHGDTIRLGMKSVPDGHSESSHQKHLHSHSARQDISHTPHLLHNTAVTLAKIAFSSGLARSVKVAVLERALDSYFDSTQQIPGLLSQGSRLPFSRSFILRKTGELLSIRAQLNFVSELTDSIPDLFWDSKSELGLETYFDQVSRALDVRVRIKVLNEKMDYASEIATILRERLSERHGFLLEWLIIFLISVEVCFASVQILSESQTRNDPSSTDALLRQWLEKELAKGTEDR